MADIIGTSAGEALTGTEQNRFAAASTSASGVYGNNSSSTPRISADGRFVAFSSIASNLTPGDANFADVFVKDMITGAIQQVSVDFAGKQISAGAFNPQISADGTKVIFDTFAPLIPGDTNGASDVYLKDLTTGVLTRISTGQDGGQLSDSYFAAALSADGTRAAFIASGLVYIKNLITGDLKSSVGIASTGNTPTRFISNDKISFARSTGLIPADTNGATDIYTFDLNLRTYSLTTSDANGNSFVSGANHASYSADGTKAVFTSAISLTEDANGVSAVYLKDLVTGEVTLVSKTVAGVPGSGPSSQALLSADGTRVVFYTEATNLVPGLSSGLVEKNLLTGEVTARTSQGRVNSYEIIGSGDLSTIAFPTSQALAPGDSGFIQDIVLSIAGGGNDTIHGGDGDDTLNGLSGNDVLYGEGGDDGLYGGAGDDTLDGGAGANDVAGYYGLGAGVTVDLAIAGPQDTGAAGIDTLIAIEGLGGTDFADVFFGEAGANNLIGYGGDDALNGRAGNDNLDGGLGNDTLIGGDGSDTASYFDAASGVAVSLAIAGQQNTGAAGLDTLTEIENLGGSQFNDALTGDGGANSLYGYDGNDTLKGGGGDDSLYGMAGDDSYDGGSGVDLASYLHASAGVTVNLSLVGPQNTIAAGVDTLVNIENLGGGNFNDTLTGDGGANRLGGGGGDDVLSGLGGADNLRASIGDDSLYGGDGDDLLAGSAGNDLIDGGAGIDTADYLDAASALTVDLAVTGPQATGGSGLDTLVGVENLLGAANQASTLSGDGAANRLTGGRLDDSLFGRGGDDVLIGGLGKDLLDGGSGLDTADYSTTVPLAAVPGAPPSVFNLAVDLRLTDFQETGLGGLDKLVGVENVTSGVGDDKLSGSVDNNTLNGGSGDDVIFGAAGNDRLIGGAGADKLDGGKGDDDLYGNTENDILSGADGADSLHGGAGDDVLEGGLGNDFEEGGQGADILKGGAGDDVLMGEAGHDRLSGLDGADTFTFGKAVEADSDRVMDFVHGVDRLAFRADQYGLSAGALDASKLVFGEVATDAHSQFVFNAATATLSWDPDGSGAASAVTIATFNTAVTLTASDFLIL